MATQIIHGHGNLDLVEGQTSQFKCKATQTDCDVLESAGKRCIRKMPENVKREDE